MIDKISGKVAYAVVAFGGFLGMGEDYYPLPWPNLKYDTRLGGYRVGVTEDQLKGFDMAHPLHAPTPATIRLPCKAVAVWPKSLTSPGFKSVFGISEMILVFTGPQSAHWKLWSTISALGCASIPRQSHTRLALPGEVIALA